MDATALKMFRAVAREGSIGRAAEKLNYVPSNLSVRIKQLEKELQVELFERLPRGMRLTEAGHHLLAYADPILNLMQEAEEATGSGKQPVEKLRLGTVEAAASSALTPLLATLRARYPEARPSVVTGVNHELIDKVVRQELHGAIVYGPLAQPELEYRKLADDELVLASADASVGLAEQLKKPLLFFEVGCSHQATVDSLLEQYGIRYPAITEFGALDTILRGVTAELGVTLLPRSSLEEAEQQGNLAIVELPESYRTLELGFITVARPERSAALQAMLDTVQELSEA
ncbi:LysR family transcriptional regulator [Paenibacillus sp. 598K]|uniref:LysR family transcriptional regulator n=1 Tax=Paenibacillus sp. 598K TaxID=1117987 RepID=UPI000FFA2AFF|nr:LysR family transcriptional regulator [Paenibacillus sp. 598K]GBF72819.1 LysR family transcriptional regulator [Paenibacillus sp. 598K]